ncbi:MAG: hypothetical protein U5Q16_11825 [Gammaproteobacteria bacterium]|nr:hypothetical protein [Gammaproteobacteria bacterium]
MEKEILVEQEEYLRNLPGLERVPGVSRANVGGRLGWFAKAQTSQ